MEAGEDLERPMDLDPEALGFMCGLEIHQQLDTGKLHSRQPSILYDVTADTVPTSWPSYRRRLRAPRGEGGAVDVAARFEARRNRTFVYRRAPNAGLIELDDAPPKEHDPNALEVGLTVAAMFEMHPVTHLQTMRKTVVDGSNTSGFQRTTLLATHGCLRTEDGDVGIDVLCLEEDSARKLETRSTDNGEEVEWNLDRLGVPLLELATAPDVRTPEHARTTAAALGRRLRDTRSVRRGLGSIRQDLNVSIACGDRVEIKGCQNLDWIPRIIRLEMVRQLHFHRLANHLRATHDLPPLPEDRRLDDAEVEARVAAQATELLPVAPIDVSAAFARCDSTMVRRGLDEHGHAMHGIVLPGFHGLLGTKRTDVEGAQLPRLGRELAAAAKLAGVAGVFHSDELPAYGITENDLTSARDALSAGSEDAIVLCLAPAWQADLALESVVLRARTAFGRIPQEVRNVVVRNGLPEDGTTQAMRPLPSGARMYPETDIRPLHLTPDHWSAALMRIPLTIEERSADLASSGLSKEQIDQLVHQELDDQWRKGVEGAWGPEVPGKAWATALLDGSLEDLGTDHGTFSERCAALATSLCAREDGAIVRDGVLPLARALIEAGPRASNHDVRLAWVLERAETTGHVPADSNAIDAVIEQVLAERSSFVAERGMAAMGPLMGVVLAALGDGADGRAVSSALKAALQAKLS